MALSKLGRSFSELIESNREESPDEIVQVPVDRLEPNPHQPRRTFDAEAIEELASSMREHGLLQPVVALRKGDGYELVAGERRFRAARSLGWTSVPARIVELDASASLQVALIENIQREELNAIECSRAYRELISRFGLTQAQLAKQLGKDRSTVTNSLRLLELPESVQLKVVENKISAGHARALLGCTSGSEIEVLAEKIVREGLSVRATEELVKDVPSGKGGLAPVRKPKLDPNVLEASRTLAQALGTKVQIRDRGNNRGRIMIDYHSLEDFDRIQQRLLGENR